MHLHLDTSGRTEEDARSTKGTPEFCQGESGTSKVGMAPRARLGNRVFCLESERFVIRKIN